jgi:hypothetical protein
MSNISIPDSKRLQGNLNIDQQRGVVAVIVALSMVVLVGFVGLALDLGKLFVTKTELQNSADACALAAARELTGANNNQLLLAEEAGITAGTSNNVQFQQDSVSIGSNNITFSDALDGTYLTKDAVANVLSMRFARCTVQRSDIANWFVQVLGIGDQQVNATAVASLVPGQTTCALPIAICSDKMVGKNPGDWISRSLDPSDNLTGDFLWATFDNQTGAKALKNTLINSGECNLPTVGQEIGTPGDIVSAYDAWNTRFGIYPPGNGQYDSINARMDYTGYAYTAKNWSTSAIPAAPFTCKNAYTGGDFTVRRSSHEPFQPTVKGDNPTGINISPSSPSSSTLHAQGTDRRIVPVPVVDCTEYLEKGSHKAAIQSWACVLMLHPLVQSNKFEGSAYACPGITTPSVFLEYLGPANDPNSPCASSGMVGGPGSIGPLVPALVQ